ncbi:hypothetical protein L6164_022878 [Bauhinia variegata]|uniref:Uncharacterized protein n=1 Tax=Bauhinia variegata TaxID=167791 RepID=A0ACB9MGS7_BAUVA|nr:hypothetical protein L6164_022878 [Bauhinia variegata]
MGPFLNKFKELEPGACFHSRFIQQEDNRISQLSQAMFAPKVHGKSRVDSTRASEGVQSRKSEGSRSFKVYSENEQLRVGDGLIKSARQASARRNALVTNKGVTLSSANKPKIGLKSMEKSKSKYGGPGSTNMRKALADVSNVQGNSVRKIGRDDSKTKLSVGSSTSTIKVSSRNSFMGRVKGSTSKGDLKSHESKRVSTGIKPPLDVQKINPNGEQTTAVRGYRKSFPVQRRLRADASNIKDNTRKSDLAEEKSGIPAKATTGRKVSSQLSNARSHLRTRVSDGFAQMVHTSMKLNTSSRKSIMPLVKTTRKASNVPRSSKSGVNKTVPAAPVSSQNEETVTSSLPEISITEVSNDAKQEGLPYDGGSNLDRTSSEFIAKKKSSRRKSYTTSLIERSKFLKEIGEVLEQDNLPSIDNECNQLEVSEYIDEIYQYYWVTEAQNPALVNYMSIQTEITAHMRGILINWLIEVHFKFDLMPETLYLSVTLLDQYLSLVTIKKSEMPLVGLTALLLASKYEDFWHPRVKDLISISAEPYTRDQMLGMEKLILRTLKFRLNAPTPYVFMVRFLKAAQSDLKLQHLAFFLIDLCLVEYEALAFKPSLLCASAIYLARCTLQVTPAWTPLLRKHTRYEVPQLRECVEMILKFHRAAGRRNLKVAYDIYSRPDHSGVAAVKPLDRLPF